MPIPRLRDWRRGDSVRSHEHHQEPVDALRRLSNQVDRLPFGDRLVFHQAFPAVIVDTGPDGDEDDLGGSQYWVRRDVIQAAGYGLPLTFIEDTTERQAGADLAGVPLAGPNVFPATNLAEYAPALADQTHNLRTDSTVEVWVVACFDRVDPAVKHYLFSRTAPDPRFVKVEKDGGTNGDATHPASYTYTVRSLAGVELGTAVPLARPRPDGTVTFQAGADGYGLAFYDGTDLKLWDAGEIPGTGSCGGA